MARTRLSEEPQSSKEGIIGKCDVIETLMVAMGHVISRVFQERNGTRLAAAERVQVGSPC